MVLCEAIPTAVPLAPFTGFEPEQMAVLTVVVIHAAVVGIAALLLIAMFRLGLLLWRKPRPSADAPAGRAAARMSPRSGFLPWAGVWTGVRGG